MAALHNQQNPLLDNPVWELAVEIGPDTIKKFQVKYIVICTGKYGDIPLMPTFPNKGSEVFQGKVLHSMEYCKVDREAITKLVVVGFKKSAIDVARIECAEVNQGQVNIIKGEQG